MRFAPCALPKVEINKRERSTMKDYDEIAREILQKALTLPDQAGRERTILKDQQAFDIAARYNASLHDIYSIALAKKILPYRYIRNLESVTIDDQLKLHEAKAAVVGAGGLGGQVIVLLARLGVGDLVVIDHDVFDETNLNRQALSSMDVLGKSKAETAKEIAGRINPAVNVTPFHTRLDNSNADNILKGSDVIVDALDNISDRFILEDFAGTLGIPLVHGAVAGFEGQIMTIFPDDAGMEYVYGRVKNTTQSENNKALTLGVPAVTPAIIASYQVIEAVKIILKKGNLLRNMLVYMDMAKCESRRLKFK